MTFTEFSCKNSSNHLFWLKILNYETCVFRLRKIRKSVFSVIQPISKNCSHWISNNSLYILSFFRNVVSGFKSNRFFEKRAFLGNETFGGFRRKLEKSNWLV